jgi:hypothetical protein
MEIRISKLPILEFIEYLQRGEIKPTQLKILLREYSGLVETAAVAKVSVEFTQLTAEGLPGLALELQSRNLSSHFFG